MAGNICHVNLPSLDLAESQEFYGSLFGWKFMPNTDSYVLFDDNGVGGGLTTASKPATEGGVVFFIEVDDIDAKLDQIEAAGGTAVIRRTPVGGPGFHGVFTDPHGNKVGLYARQ